MATLQVGNEVDVVVDGIGVRRGVVHEIPSATVVVVRITCNGNPCEYGYRHPAGARIPHMQRVRAPKVNPAKMPKPLLTYDQLDWGTD